MKLLIVFALCGAVGCASRTVAPDAPVLVPSTPAPVPQSIGTVSPAEQPVEPAPTPQAPQMDSAAKSCETEVTELRAIDEQREYIYQINHAAIREGSTRATYEYLRDEIVKQCMFSGCRFSLPDVSTVIRAVRAIEAAEDEASLDALATGGQNP